jgi:hypothetical protein
MSYQNEPRLIVDLMSGGPVVYSQEMLEYISQALTSDLPPLLILAQLQSMAMTSLERNRLPEYWDMFEKSGVDIAISTSGIGYLRMFQNYGALDRRRTSLGLHLAIIGELFLRFSTLHLLATISD